MLRLIQILFFVGDALLLNGAILISFYLYPYNSIFVNPSDTLYLFIYSNLAWLFLMIVSNPYHIDKGWPIPKIIKSQIAFFLIHLLVIISLNIFFKKHYGLIQIGLIYFIFIPLFFISKLIVFYLKKLLFREKLIRNYILIGKNDLAYKLRAYYLSNPEEQRRFFCYFDYQDGKLPVEKIQHFCSTKEIHEIYCCISNVEQNVFNQLVEFGLNSFIKVKLILSPNLQGEAIYLAKYDETLNTGTAAIPLDEPSNQITKRAFDIVFSFLVTLFILSWAVPIIGLLIVLDSPGPIFFVQRRNGEENRIFHCIKFRTMKVNTEADNKLSPKNDQRVTRLGCFLRKTSIDELPQFINVLFGTMSVVGPRPHMLKVTEDYRKFIKKFMGRHYIKPGITGLAQCLGYRGDKTGEVLKDLTDMENRIKMDLHYIENWSFMLDIKIIFRTIIGLLKSSE